MVQRPEDQGTGMATARLSGTRGGGSGSQNSSTDYPSFSGTFRKLKRMVDENGDMSAYPIHYRFQVIPPPSGSSSDDPSDLCCMIQEAGGELCSDRDEGSKEYALKILDVMALADCPHHDLDVPDDTYSSAFIYASIENQMKNLDHPDPKIFLLTTSIYGSYDPRQILLRNKKWSDMIAVSEPTTYSSKYVIESLKLHKTSAEQQQQQISNGSHRSSSNQVDSGTAKAKTSGVRNLTFIADEGNSSQSNEEFFSLTQSQQGQQASEKSSTKKSRQEVVEERRSVRSPSVHMVPASPPLIDSTRKRRRIVCRLTVEDSPERQMRSPSIRYGKSRGHATASKPSSKKVKECERSTSPVASDQDQDRADSTCSPKQAIRRSPRTKGSSQKEHVPSSSKNKDPPNSTKSTDSSVRTGSRRIFKNRVPVRNLSSALNSPVTSTTLRKGRSRNVPVSSAEAQRDEQEPDSRDRDNDAGSNQLQLNDREEQNTTPRKRKKNDDGTGARGTKTKDIVSDDDSSGSRNDSSFSNSPPPSESRPQLLPSPENPNPVVVKNVRLVPKAVAGPSSAVKNHRRRATPRTRTDQPADEQWVDCGTQESARGGLPDDTAAKNDEDCVVSDLSDVSYHSESSGVDNDSDAHQRARPKKGVKEPFSSKEDKLIVKNVFDKDAVRYTKGYKLWKLMARSKDFKGRRTFYSLHNRWRSTIVPRLLSGNFSWQFKLNKQQLERVRKQEIMPHHHDKVCPDFEF